MPKITEGTLRGLPTRMTADIRGISLDRTVPKTGLLEALATVEGFVPLFDENTQG
jgi:hypothetical protein